MCEYAVYGAQTSLRSLDLVMNPNSWDSIEGKKNELSKIPKDSYKTRSISSDHVVSLTGTYLAYCSVAFGQAVGIIMGHVGPLGYLQMRVSDP